MLYRTHLSFGLLAGFVVWSYFGFFHPYSSKFGFIFGLFVFFGLVSLGALLPDLDHPKSKMGHRIPAITHFFHFMFGHRGFLHSIFFVLIIGGGTLLIFGNLYSFPLMIGMIAHLLSDCLTKEGVNLIYPFHQLSVHGFIETGSVAEFLLFFLSAGVLLTLIFGPLFF